MPHPVVTGRNVMKGYWHILYLYIMSQSPSSEPMIFNWRHQKGTFPIIFLVPGHRGRSICYNDHHRHHLPNYHRTVAFHRRHHHHHHQHPRWVSWQYMVQQRRHPIIVIIGQGMIVIDRGRSLPGHSLEMPSVLA